MSQPSAASSRAIQEQIDELIAEMAFQRVLLSSIDDSVADREEAEAEVKAEIKSIEKQIRQLRRSLVPSISKPASASQRSLNSSTPSQHWNSSHHAAMDATSPGTGGNSLQGLVNLLSAAPSTASTPNSSNSMDHPSLRLGLSPSQRSLPSRKRSHSSHSGGDLLQNKDAKTRRMSPSPFRSIPDTPPTGSSDDEDFADFQEEYRKRQLAEERRIEREREDGIIARNFQDEPLSIVYTNSGHNSTPSAFDRISGIRAMQSSSRSGSSAAPQFGQPSKPGGRTLPWNQSSSLVASSSMSGANKTHFGMKREDIPSSDGLLLRPNRQSSMSPHIPGAFREDLAISSDSDLEIISSSEFEKKNRQTVRKQSPRSLFGTPPPRSVSEAASRRLHSGSSATNMTATMEAFGKHLLPAWMCQPGIPQEFDPSIAPASARTVSSQLGMPKRNGVKAEPGLGPGVSAYDQRYNHYMPATFQAFNGALVHPVSGSSQNPYGLAPYMLDPLNHRMADELDYVMNDPRKTTQEIKELLENIRPDIELPPEDREGTPEGLKYPLYEHQKLALTWVKSQEEGTNKGGILADDMGLGKTITALALLLSRPPTDRARKTTLIVGPVALVRQWNREIRTKIKPGHRLSTHMVHGQGKKLSWDELRNFDIVLTTYGTLGAEYGRLVKYLEKQQKEGNQFPDQAPMRMLFSLLGPASQFYRIILDEAQCIKNKNTKAARAACCLKSVHRWCLTGTPMMNNVGELYSLVHFLRIRPYSDLHNFQSSFGMLTKGDRTKRQVETAMKKLQALLKAILLRRVKTSLIDGKPIITLPPKTEEIQHVVFNKDELDFYKALETKTQIMFNKYVRAGTVGRNYSNILVLLLRLRQCCCHPHLIMDFEQAPTGGTAPNEAMIALAKTLAPEVVARLLEAEGFECPVCYDASENPSIVIPCGHDTCAECLSKISDQALQQNVANGEIDAVNSAKCPTCQGKLDLRSIIDYATFKKVHVKDSAIDDDEMASEDSDSETESDSDSETESGEDSNGDLRDFIVPDDAVDEEEEEEEGNADNEEDAPVNKPKSKLSKPKKPKKSKKSKDEKRRRKIKDGKKKEAPKHVSISMLKKEASKSAEGKRHYRRYLRKNWQPSAKIDKCVELLQRFQEEDQKTIVFSQFVSLLDLLRVPIDGKDWDCERYDGSMSADARNDAIVRFTDKPNCKIMLISLKAGNAGLNLVAASRVIILDPFWNPYIEMQAVDRAYRIGQQRPVEVHRILIQQTVEDRIIELQEQKRDLVDAALDEGASRSLGRLDERQLAFLFGVGQ